MVSYRAILPCHLLENTLVSSHTGVYSIKITK